MITLNLFLNSCKKGAYTYSISNLNTDAHKSMHFRTAAALLTAPRGYADFFREYS